MPPSSPTLVDIPLEEAESLSAWQTSTPARRASEKVSKPAGIIMNSWRSSLLEAWRPPLMMFIMGTGSRFAEAPPRYLNNGISWYAAAALAAAMDTARTALAPRRLLSGVPSSLISSASRRACSSAGNPMTAGAMTRVMFSTALRTPLPLNSDEPSRSSQASCPPVEAPLGTAARPKEPSARRTSASTVGLPLESSICLALTSMISLM